MSTITIIKDGCTNGFVIALPQSADITEQTAAKELAEYISKATGAELPIVDESAANQKAIYLGHTDYAKEYGVQCEDEEQWYLKAYGGNLIISGGSKASDRGTLYGVFHFLEDIVGVRWWNYWEEYVPVVDELKISKDLQLSGKPFFKSRKISDLYYERDYRFIVRNRMHGCISSHGFANSEMLAETHKAFEFSKEYGGMPYAGGPGGVHTTNLYVPASEYFDEHPEWFAWDDNFKERNSMGQHCYSNEELEAEMLKKVLEAIQVDYERADKGGYLRPEFFSISLADSGGHCQCDACRASVEKSGLVGYMLQFVNRIARSVSKIYPDVMIETLAYMLYQEPPTDETAPDKNVLIRLADIFVDMIHDITHKNNSDQLRRLKAWKALCEKNGSPLRIWDYCTYQFPHYPLPVAFKYAKNLKLFADLGVEGLYIENHENATNGMWAIQEWLLAKLMENPYADEETLMDDFIFKYYGAAGEYVKKYLHLVHNASEKYGQRVILFLATTRTNYIDLDVVLQGNDLLVKAENAIREDKILYERIRTLRADLDRVIVIRYEDFKSLAEKRCVRFNIQKADAVDRILESYDITERKYAPSTGSQLKHLLLERKIFSMRKEELQKCELPEELQHISSENIYEIPVRDILRLIDDGGLGWQTGYGAVDVSDTEAMDGFAHKLDYHNMNDKMKRRFAFSARGEQPDVPLLICVKRTAVWEDSESSNILRLYREDLVPDKYALYALKGIKGISSDSDSTLSLFAPHNISVDLSAISQMLPGGSYDAYIRMKFTGEIYGGRADGGNAIYLDRIYIVKTDD